VMENHPSGLAPETDVLTLSEDGISPSLGGEQGIGTSRLVKTLHPGTNPNINITSQPESYLP